MENSFIGPPDPGDQSDMQRPGKKCPLDKSAPDQNSAFDSHSKAVFHYGFHY